ncbi:MAG: DNA polymerase IV [Bacteroidetes bacterium]|nr:DNA polymerase IV [Bacteroidota bacterium]
MALMNQNTSESGIEAAIMYVDMNSFFASCEQQERKELRGKPIGVITHPSDFACVIAPSVEAKRRGVKTGMRLPECKAVCPEMIPVVARPYIYRLYHVRILNVLKAYCDDVIPKSIDEAVLNFTTYRLVYKDLKEVALKIKADLADTEKGCGPFVKCSIGIAPNSFLAKLGTEIQKPDGLVEITRDNIDGYLKNMKLTDLPGIARANERRLQMIGIKTPYDMRHSSEALLRKAFGGVVGNYWHRRLNFREVDFYQSDYKAMSATRMVSRLQREDPQALESLFISLCTRLEQRMVKQNVYCKTVSFYMRYHDIPTWETTIHLNDATQDAVEMRLYIMQQVDQFEQSRNFKIFNNKVQSMGVIISGFIKGDRVQYSLFDNKIKQDKARKTLYHIKDKYGRDVVRKASETIRAHEMRDAIGFGSVKDFNGVVGAPDAGLMNQYLLENDAPRPVPKHVLEIRARKQKQKIAEQLIQTGHDHTA